MKSEELKHLASTEENDLKAMGILNKAMREARIEKFVETYVKSLSEKYTVTYNEKMHRFSIDAIDTEFRSVIDFYPKVNKVLIRKKNKWIVPGLKWIIKNLIKPQ